MKQWTYILLSVAASMLAQAAYTNATLNITACGGTMSGGDYTSIGSFSPVGGQNSQSASYYSYSGFASGFILQPGTAFSGLSDELNPDNDRDGLLDDEEIVIGSSLYSNDTDGDGMHDAQELIAGTSLTNRSSVLSVICTLLPNGQKELSWFGVAGRAYTLQYTDSLLTNWQSYPSELSGTGTAILFTDTESSSNRFYRVKVRVTE